MFSRFRLPPRYPLETTMVGKCGTCNRVVEAEFWECKKYQTSPAAVEAGVWSDLYFLECPGCRARVYVVEKQNS